MLDDELLSALLGRHPNRHSADQQRTSQFPGTLRSNGTGTGNKEVHADYQTLLEAQMGPQQAEFNAFLESIAPEA